MLVNHAVVVVLLLVVLGIFFFTTKKFLKTRDIIDLDPNNTKLNAAFVAIFNLIIAIVALYLLVFLYSTIFNLVIYFWGDTNNMLSINGSADTFANLLTILTIISAIILTNNKSEKSKDKENLTKLIKSNIKLNNNLAENIDKISTKLDNNDKLISDNLNSRIEGQYTTLILGLIKDNHEIFNDVHIDIENLVNTIQIKLGENYGAFIYLSDVKLDDSKKETIIQNLRQLADKESKKKDLIKVINRIIKEINVKNYEMISSLYLFKNKKLGEDPETYSDIKAFYLTNNFSEKEFIQELYDAIFTSDITDIFSKKFDGFDNYYKEHSNKYAYIKNICSEEFEDKYHKLGHFYRHIHRIIKTIHQAENSIDSNVFVGILRAQLSEKIIISLYYNCIYTEKGYGMGLQLLNTDFFGTVDDFDNTYSLHFSTNYLLNKNVDIKLIKKLFCSENATNIDNFEEYSTKIKETFLV